MRASPVSGGRSNAERVCLVLYLAASDPLPTVSEPSFFVELLDDRSAPVVQWFSLPEVRFIGVEGCSCACPDVMCEEPTEWFEMFFNEEEDRDKQLASVDLLFDVIRQQLESSPEVQLYPVWDGEEASAPKLASNRMETLVRLIRRGQGLDA